jgi:hypothetical protein
MLLASKMVLLSQSFLVQFQKSVVPPCSAKFKQEFFFKEKKTLAGSII